MGVFWLSLAAIFGMEMFDKTQLVAMCLAARYRAGVVLAGILAATLLVHVISVLIGGGVGKLLPVQWVNLVAGLAFIGFGLWTLKGDDLDCDQCGTGKARSPFMLVATTFFLAELGDKTMISTVTLATKYPLLPVWLGSSLGMVVSDGLAIIVGQVLGAKLPERAIKIGAAIIFFACGAYTAAEGATKLPAYGWAVAAGATLLMVLFYLYQVRKERDIAPRLDQTPEPVVESEAVGVAER